MTQLMHPPWVQLSQEKLIISFQQILETEPSQIVLHALAEIALGPSPNVIKVLNNIFRCILVSKLVFLNYLFIINF